MQFNWLKISAIILLVYAIVGGLLLPVPELSQLGETIRNLYYHVCMWFAMMILYTISIIHSIKYLRNGKIEHDIKAVSYAGTGTYMGLLGYATGAYFFIRNVVSINLDNPSTFTKLASRSGRKSCFEFQ